MQVVITTSLRVHLTIVYIPSQYRVLITVRGVGVEWTQKGASNFPRFNSHIEYIRYRADAWGLHPNYLAMNYNPIHVFLLCILCCM